MNASSAVLRETGSQADLASPRRDLFKKGALSTTVRAERGLLNTETQDMELTGSVIVVAHKERATLRTEALDYASTRKRFLTDKPVTVQRPDSVLRGRGLEATQDLSEIRIHRMDATIQ